MPAFNIDIEVAFEVFCGKCGQGICHLADTRTSHNRNVNQVTVIPCENCIDEAKEKGYEEGLAEAQQEIDELKEQIEELKERLLI